jgi:hypothetical protein
MIKVVNDEAIGVLFHAKSCAMSCEESSGSFTLVLIGLEASHDGDLPS